MSQFEHCLERVIGAVRACKKEELGEIGPGTNLEEDLAFDSLDLLMLAGELEEEFDFTVEPEQLAGIATVEDIVRRLEQA